MQVRAETVAPAVVLSFVPLAVVGLLLYPRPAIAGLVALGLCVAMVLRPLWSVYLTMVAAFVPAPTSIPTALPIGGHSVKFYELALALAAAVMVAKYPAPRRANQLAVLGGAFLVVEIVHGYAAGNQRDALIADSRSMVALWLAYLVASRLPASGLGPSLLRLLKWILWVGAGLTILGAAGVISLAGRDEAADLFLNGATTGGSTRLITSATHLSLAVVCAVLAVLVSGRVPLRDLWPFLLPALVPVFISYSRNSVLALVTAFLFAALAERRVGVVGRILAVLAVGAGLATALVVLSGNGALRQAFQSYGTRVIGGLSPSTISTDASAQYRVLENYYLLASWRQAPLLGHGLGATYRPATGSTGSFAATYATFYAHNLYYWLLVKSGVIGTAAWLTFAVGSLFSRRNHRTALQLGAATAGAALLAISVVAPMPLGTDSASCVVLGAALGLAASVRRDDDADTAAASPAGAGRVPVAAAAPSAAATAREASSATSAPRSGHRSGATTAAADT